MVIASLYLPQRSFGYKFCADCESDGAEGQKAMHACRSMAGT